MLASLDNATGLVFISFPSESRSLFLLSVLAFGWAGSVVRSLPGAVDPASSLLVSTLDCLGGNHSPALERHFGRMRRWLQHSRRRDGGRREILGINKGVSKAGFGWQNESKRPESVYVAKVLCVSSVTLLSHTCGVIHKHSCDVCTRPRRMLASAVKRVNEADGLREVECELRDRSGREGGSVTVSSCLCDLTDFPLSMNQCRVSLSHYSYEASGLP